MKEKLIEILEEVEGQYNNDFPSIEQMADGLIAHGVTIQKNARWIENTCRSRFDFKYDCSICHGGSDLKGNYCPNCGAKMDGDGNG